MLSLIWTHSGILKLSSWKHEHENFSFLKVNVAGRKFFLSLALFPQRQTWAIHQPSLTVTALKMPETGNWSEINCKTCGLQGKEFDS